MCPAGARCRERAETRDARALRLAPWDGDRPRSRSAERAPRRPLRARAAQRARRACGWRSAPASDRGRRPAERRIRKCRTYWGIGVNYSRWCARGAASSALRRDVILARAWLKAAHRQPHADVVHLAVALRRREAEQILAMQLVEHAREGLSQVVARAQFGITAARLERGARQRGIGLVGHHGGGEAAGANAHRRALAAAAAHADAIDHDVFATRADDHLALADEALAEQRPAVGAVAEHQHHAAAIRGCIE